MFHLFSRNKPPECPIDDETRLWMENAFLWLATQFGQDQNRNKRTLVPRPQDFPIRYDGSTESLTQTAEIVAAQMEVDLDEVELHVYQQNVQEFGQGFGHRFFTEADNTGEEKMSSGLYFEKDEAGRYGIFIEEKNLLDPEGLVATLAHEFAHIKLLGEKRLEENDEMLTDLCTVVLGLGIFNANSSFKELKSFDSWGHHSVGYLKQREWGYALSLYAHFRAEEDPDWVQYLTPNLRSDFKKGQAYIGANWEKVFREDYKGSKGDE